MSSNPNAQDGGIRTTVNDKATEAYSYAQRSLDRVVAPSSRKRAYDNAAAYARARPILFVRRRPLPFFTRRYIYYNFKDILIWEYGASLIASPQNSPSSSPNSSSPSSPS